MRRAPSLLRPLRFLAVALTALAVSGCQQMFTTSLASWATRPNPPVPKTLTQDQATMYAQEVVDNRDTAKAQALLPAMAALVAGNPGDEGALAAAALTAGVASGLDEAFAAVFQDVGLEALLSGSPTVDQIAAIAAALVSVEVGAEAGAIFSVLAGSSAAEVAALAENGASAGTFAIAAAAILIAAVPDNELANLVDGNSGNDGALTIPAAAQTDAANLISLAQAQWPSDPLIAALTGLITQLP
ncbi:MAG: hypothetical protein JNG85_12265 [Spirochaetaceae bacterium]|nr:hypothetical protein [Spirochaetaceae bacterium]